MEATDAFAATTETCTTGTGTDGTRNHGAGNTGTRTDGAGSTNSRTTDSRATGTRATGSWAKSSRPDGTPIDRRGHAAADDGAEACEDQATRVRRIDETLTRMTAAHAGFTFGGAHAAPDDARTTAARPRPRLARIAVLVVAALVMTATGVGWMAQRWLVSAVPAAAALDLGSGAIVDPADQQGAENVLLVATDRGGSPEVTAQPDTVVVAHLPAGNGPPTVLSIPPDIEVDRPDCARFDAASSTYLTDTVPAQARTPLVSALEVGGPRCATRAVQQLTGLAVTRYVGLDLGGLDTAVDTVSGVRVCTPRAVVDATLGPVAPTPGPVVLDTRRAGDFVRAAAVAGDTAGGRVERQQQVVAAVLGAALSDAGLLDLPALNARRQALGRAFTTDAADLDQVLALARSLDDLGGTGVAFATVPADPDPAGQGVIPRPTEAAALFDALRTGAALPTGASGQAIGPRPADVHLQVRNATDRAGLAGKTADTLRGLGFAVAPVTNAGSPTPQTLIRYSPDQTAAAELLAATVPTATTVPDPGESGVLELVLGRSFDGVVRASTTTQAGPAAVPAPAAADCR